MSCSTEWKEWTQKRFSLRVWVKRSTQPLSSGSGTKVRELWILKNRSSFWIHWQGRRCHGHGGATGRKGSPQHIRQSVLEYLANRLEGFETVAALVGVDADRFGRGMTQLELTPRGETDGRAGVPLEVKRSGFGFHSLFSGLLVPKAQPIYCPKKT